jgi:predicted nucleic acid-binding protein
MILVDTSAWIEFFRDREPVATRVDALLEANDVAICGPVVTELRRGLRSASDRARVLPLLEACHLLDQPASLWEEVGDIGFSIRRVGINVKTVDLLIAAYAVSHAVPLLTMDRDFALVQQAGVPLTLAPM